MTSLMTDEMIRRLMTVVIKLMLNNDSYKIHIWHSQISIGLLGYGGGVELFSLKGLSHQIITVRK